MVSSENGTCVVRSREPCMTLSLRTVRPETTRNWKGFRKVDDFLRTNERYV